MMKKNTNSNATVQLNLLPWNGEVLHAEAVKPGGKLMGALLACASQRGHTLEQLGNELGVTYGYLSQLRSGVRPVGGIRIKVARQCARYLGIAPIKVLMMSGKLDEQDFMDPADDRRSQLIAALDAIYGDARWGQFITESLKDADEKIQRAVVRMFEEATDTQLLPAVAAYAEGGGRQLGDAGVLTGEGQLEELASC